MAFDFTQNFFINWEKHFQATFFNVILSVKKKNDILNNCVNTYSVEIGMKNLKKESLELNKPEKELFLTQ